MRDQQPQLLFHNDANDCSLPHHRHPRHRYATPPPSSSLSLGSSSPDVNMSVSHSLVWKRPVAQTQADDGEFRRKKLKLNDLPISSAKKQAIDGLLVSFKKSGEFDRFRKGIFGQFETSVCIRAPSLITWQFLICGFV